MKNFVRNLIWIIPVSLGLGALLSLLQARGIWWIGWLGFSTVLFLGLVVLTTLWRWAGAGRTLAWVMALSVFLRLGLGIAFTYILPVAGYGTGPEKSGYLFLDAVNRDNKAWKLASTGQPLWLAFDKSYSYDQYGGMMALSALAYRTFSPDAQRPWLIILLTSLTAGIGVAVAWKVVKAVGGENAAKVAVWILALYPESVLQGSSQMREPFLITFIAMLFWGVVDWQSGRRQGWLWMIGSLVGMLLFSPGIAVFAVLVLAGWILLQGERRKLSWQAILIAAGVVVLALFLIFLSLKRGPYANASPLVILTGWLRTSAAWDVHELEPTSGWIQRIFDELPESLQLPFMTGYGVTQPVLPGVLVNPANWVWKIINIFRATGWYALIPLLVFSLVAVWKIPKKSERRAWIWLWVTTWIWIFLASYRAGGDQWDNPRYRVWMLLWQALLAAKAWTWWKGTRNPWLGRILAVEGVFLTFFLYWYIVRHLAWTPGQMHVFIVIAAILIVSSLILVWGWITDCLRARKSRRT